MLISYLLDVAKSKLATTHTQPMVQTEAHPVHLPPPPPPTYSPNSNGYQSSAYADAQSSYAQQQPYDEADLEVDRPEQQPTIPWKTSDSTRARLRRVVLALVLGGLTISNLICGLQSINDICKYPLAMWMVVGGCVQLAQTALIVCRLAYVIAVKPSDKHSVPIVPLWFKLVNLLFLLCYIVYVYTVGSYWVWNSSDSTGNSDLYDNAQSLLVTSYIVFGVIVLIRVRQAVKGRLTTASQ